MAMQATDIWQQYIDSGNAACRERRYDEAEQFYARALSEAEQTGISEDCLALSINNLAWVSHRLGKYRQAEPLYLRALSLVRRLCGLEHPDVATVLQNMARMYSASERGDIAEQMLRQALDIRRKAFGPDNDQVLATHEEFRRLLRENEARIKAAQKENENATNRSTLKSLAEDIAGSPEPALQIPESLAVTSDPVSQMSRLDPSEAVTQLASQIEAITMLEDSQACTIDPVHADLNNPQRQTKQMEPAAETVARIEDSQACTIDPIRQASIAQPQFNVPPVSQAAVAPQVAEQPAPQVAQLPPPQVSGGPRQVPEVPAVNSPAPKAERPGPIKINAPQPAHTNQAANQLKKANSAGFKIPRPGATPRVVPPVPNFVSDQASTLTELKASEITAGLAAQIEQESNQEFVQEPIEQSVLEPVQETIEQPIQEPTPEPVQEAIEHPVSESSPEPVQEAIEQSLQEYRPEAVQESPIDDQSLNPVQSLPNDSLETTVDYACSPFAAEPEAEQPVATEPPRDEIASQLPFTSLVKPALPNAAIRPEAQPDQAMQARVNPTPGEGKNPLHVKLPRPDAVAGPIPEIPPFVVTDNAETLMEVKVSQVMAGIPKEILESYSEDGEAVAPATPDAPVAQAPAAEPASEAPVEANVPDMQSEQPAEPVQRKAADEFPAFAESPQATTQPEGASGPESSEGQEVIMPGAEVLEDKRQGKRKRKAVKAKLPRPGVVPAAMPQVPSFINSDQIATLAEIPTGGLFDDDEEDAEPAAPVQPVIGGLSFFEDQPAPVAIKIAETTPTLEQEPVQLPPVAAMSPTPSMAPVQPTAPQIAASEPAQVSAGAPGVMLPPKIHSGQFPQLELPPPVRVNQPTAPAAPNPVAPPVPASPLPASAVPLVAPAAQDQGELDGISPHPSNVSQTSVPPLPGFIRDPQQPVMPFRSDIDLGSSSVPPPVAPNAVPPVPSVPPHHVPPVPAIGAPQAGAAVPISPPLPQVLKPELPNTLAQSAPVQAPLSPASEYPQSPDAASSNPPMVAPIPGAPENPVPGTVANTSEQARPAFVPQQQPSFSLGESISFPEASKDQKAFPEFFSGSSTEVTSPPPIGFASVSTNLDPESDETVNLDRLGRAPDQLNTMNNIPKIKLVPPAPKPQPVFGQSSITGGPPPVEVAEPITKQRIPRSFEHIEDDEVDDDPWTAAPTAEKTSTSSLRKAVTRHSVSPKSLEDLVDPSEKMFDVMTTCVGAAIYGLSLLFLIGFIYLPIMIAAFIFRSTVLQGKVVSNGIKVSERQFPEIFTIVSELSSMMAMPVPPTVYIVNRDSFPNKFSPTRYRRDYIVLFADVLDSLAEAEVSFLLAREMAHLKRGHTGGSLVRLPAMFIPYVGAGYARGCELTADRFGKYFKPEGARMGLVYLMCSPKLVKKVNMEALYRQAEDEQDTKLFDAFDDQPSLSKRIKEMSKVVKIG